MEKNTSNNRIISFACLILGVVLLIAAIYLDFMYSNGMDMLLFGANLTLYRGTLLVLGAIAILIGLYKYPTDTHHRDIINIIFLFPLLFTFVITVILPLIMGIYYSFTDWNGTYITKMVGFENYEKAFSHPEFIYSTLLTILFVIINMITVNVVAFLLALLCSSKLKGVGFFRAAYFLPNLIGGIVLGYIWQFIFSYVILEQTKSLFHIKTGMLGDTKLAFIAVIIVYVWQYAGYIMLIYITGLNTVPREVLEASAIDGANPIQTLFRIKLPMIASTITICTFLTLTNAFKMFDVNLALTGGQGSVDDFMGQTLTNGTELLALNIYSTSYTQQNFALAQAKAVLFFIILTCVSLIQVRVSNSKEVEM